MTPELESVVLRALMKDPQERFADADEFIAALEAAASRIPSAARDRRRRGRRRRAAGRAARRRRRYGAAAAGRRRRRR